MEQNSKNFCLTIYPNTIKHILFLGLDPVILGDYFCKENFFSDKTLDNIASKNRYYGEYTFHYWLWKNYLNKLKNYKWISFSTYRRFWVKKNLNINSLTNLKKNLLKDFKIIDQSHEVILTKPLILGNTKRIKIIKNYGLINSLKDPALILKLRYSLYDHFKIFHGEFFLKESINLLYQEDKSDFVKFLKTNKFNAHNMFIVKNAIILERFYNKIFPWLFKCEEFFGLHNFKGYEIRKLGFLAELYLNFYFKKYHNTYEANYIFYDTNKL